MTIPASTFAEMLNHPLRLCLTPSDFCNFGAFFHFIACDEAQDASVAQACLLQSVRSEHTTMLVVFDQCQRIFSFASADPEALDILTSGASHGTLSNNFRSEAAICEVIESVLTEDCGVERIVRSIKTGAGIVLHDQTLCPLDHLYAYLSEGSVAFLCRLTACLLSLLHVIRQDSKRIALRTTWTKVAC